MVGYQEVKWLPNSMPFYLIQNKIRIFAVGFSGIAVIGWVGANLKWMKCKSSDGRPFDAMQVQSKRIANQVISPVVLGSARLF
jgi:hypothetical protein